MADNASWWGCWAGGFCLRRRRRRPSSRLLARRARDLQDRVRHRSATDRQLTNTSRGLISDDMQAGVRVGWISKSRSHVQRAMQYGSAARMSPERDLVLATTLVPHRGWRQHRLELPPSSLANTNADHRPAAIPSRRRMLARRARDTNPRRRHRVQCAQLFGFLDASWPFQSITLDRQRAACSSPLVQSLGSFRVPDA